MKLSEIVRQVGGTLEGDGEVEICGVAGVGEAVAGEISFIANPKYASQAAATRASAVLVAEDWADECPAALIRIQNPDAAFAQVATLFYTPAPLIEEGIHPSAVVADDLELGEGSRVGPLCVIEAGARIGANTTISAQCYIGHQVQVGENCHLYPQVSVREFATIGNRTIIHSGTVVGSDGFGYSVDEEGIRTKIPQTGTVQIGDDVEIGANVAIDRARFGKTRIGNGVKIDNLVQIAHNVVIEDHAVIIAQVVIAGSSTVGSKAIMAGQSAVAGHLKIGAGAIVGGQSAVTKDVPPGEYVIGFPAIPARRFKRQQASIVLLPKLKKRLIEVEKKLAALQEEK
jgi:UDP-3-O-[3-hydroxymyristoyl] glucosamine N-acyltransferase